MDSAMVDQYVKKPFWSRIDPRRCWNKKKGAPLSEGMNEDDKLICSKVCDVTNAEIPPTPTRSLWKARLKRIMNRIFTPQCMKRADNICAIALAILSLGLLGALLAIYFPYALFGYGICLLIIVGMIQESIHPAQDRRTEDISTTDP